MMNGRNTQLVQPNSYSSKDLLFAKHVMYLTAGHSLFKTMLFKLGRSLKSLPIKIDYARKDFASEGGSD